MACQSRVCCVAMDSGFFLLPQGIPVYCELQLNALKYSHCIPNYIKIYTRITHGLHTKNPPPFLRAGFFILRDTRRPPVDQIRRPAQRNRSAASSTSTLQLLSGLFFLLHIQKRRPASAVSFFLPLMPARPIPQQNSPPRRRRLPHFPIHCRSGCTAHRGGAPPVRPGRLRDPALG